MFNWLMKKLTDYWEKKCQREMCGIPMCWVMYLPDKTKPNMIFELHPMFIDDRFLNKVFQMVADYMRDKYLEVEGEEKHG